MLVHPWKGIFAPLPSWAYVNKNIMQEKIYEYLVQAGKQVEDDFVVIQQDAQTLAMNLAAVVENPN